MKQVSIMLGLFLIFDFVCSDNIEKRQKKQHKIYGKVLLKDVRDVFETDDIEQALYNGLAILPKEQDLGLDAQKALQIIKEKKDQNWQEVIQNYKNEFGNVDSLFEAAVLEKKYTIAERILQNYDVKYFRILATVAYNQNIDALTMLLQEEKVQNYTELNRLRRKEYLNRITNQFELQNIAYAEIEKGTSLMWALQHFFANPEKTLGIVELLLTYGAKARLLVDNHSALSQAEFLYTQVTDNNKAYVQQIIQLLEQADC